MSISPNINVYDVGKVVRIWAYVFDTNGDPVDPASIVMKYKDPSNSITTVNSPTKQSTGVYYTDITIDEAGMWFYSSVGTGANQVAGENRFLVKQQNVV